MQKVVLNSLYEARGDVDAMIRLQTELLPKAEVNSENGASFFPVFHLYQHENALKWKEEAVLRRLCYSFTSPTSDIFKKSCNLFSPEIETDWRNQGN